MTRKAAPTPARPETPVKLAPNVQRALRELRELRAKRDDLEARITDKTKKIKEAMGTHEEAEVGGVVVVTWKQALRQSIDQTKLKENYPDAAAACLRQTYVRTFKILGDA
jgi:predicted phage-related endonuclease